MPNRYHYFPNIRVIEHAFEGNLQNKISNHKSCTERPLLCKTLPAIIMITFGINRMLPQVTIHLAAFKQTLISDSRAARKRASY